MDTNKENFLNIDKIIKTIKTTKTFKKDNDFKIIFSEPKVALKLIRTLIPYLDKYSKLSADEIINRSIDTYLFMDHELKGKTLEEKENIIIEKPTEYISEGGKEFRCDVLFEYKVGNDVKDLYTINIEMQQRKKSYNMLTRALYYAMNISSQKLKPSEDYNRINKVYSIWLLDFNYFKDSIPIHSIAPRVFYNTKSEILTNITQDQSVPIYDKGADSIEIVFIELKKRKNITNATGLKEILDVICENKNTKKTLKTLFDLSDKEVDVMTKSKSIVELIAEEIAEERAEEIAERKAEENKKVIAKNALNMGLSINQVSELTGLSEAQVKNL